MNIRLENGSVHLINPKTQEKASIQVDCGGTLTSLQLLAKSEIHELITVPYQQKYPLQENPFYPSGLLMPWVNRVRNGNYSYLGKNYQLPINETNLGNAIHGFMARKPMKITKEIANDSHALVELSFDYDGHWEGYPFKFRGELTYNLTSSGILEFTISCENTGETAMPFACGWHPYFTLGNKLSDLTVYFDSVEKYLSDSQMIPLCAEPFSAKNGMKLGLEKPDNVFLLHKNQENSVVLSNEKKQLQLEMRFDATQYPYFVAFCPENEECIALEPMTGNTDCFNTFEGLIHLEANRRFDGKVQISLSEIGQNE